MLVAVDVYSRKLFTRALKNKEAEAVRGALQSIFREANVVPNALATDGGREFTGNAAFFKDNRIQFRVKRGLNKAAMAEGYIKILRRKISLALKSKGSRDWKAILPLVTANINSSPLKALGGLSPASIKSPLDDLK